MDIANKKYCAIMIMAMQKEFSQRKEIKRPYRRTIG